MQCNCFGLRDHPESLHSKVQGKANDKVMTVANCNTLFIEECILIVYQNPLKSSETHIRRRMPHVAVWGSG
ncbi:MAG: hypothetical protein NVS1B11_17550 [Terriglobales bacterium]